MENPIYKLMDDLGVPPIVGNPHMVKPLPILVSLIV